MNVTPQKKGMSKGCLIALIVAGVLLVMIIAAAITCYMKRDDLMKFGLTSVINQTKFVYAKQVDQPLDTTVFNAMIDSIAGRVSSDTTMLSEDGLLQSQQLITNISSMVSDENIDAAEIEQLRTIATTVYPDLNLPGELEIDYEVDTMEYEIDTTRTMQSDGM